MVAEAPSDEIVIANDQVGAMFGRVGLRPQEIREHIWERMYLPDPTPDSHVETRFDPDGEGTLMTLRMTLPDVQTRRNMLATGMESGMETSYARLEGMIQHV